MKAGVEGTDMIAVVRGVVHRLAFSSPRIVKQWITIPSAFSRGSGSSRYPRRHHEPSDHVVRIEVTPFAQPLLELQVWTLALSCELLKRTDALAVFRRALGDEHGVQGFSEQPFKLRTLSGHLTQASRILGRRTVVHSFQDSIKKHRYRDSIIGLYLFLLESRKAQNGVCLVTRVNSA